MNIDHIAIWVNDLERQKEFFIRYFDCIANEKYLNPKKLFSSYFVSFKNGARIELMKKEGIHPSGQQIACGLAHFAIDAGSREMVDELTGLLERDGITIEGHPRVTGDGYYESIVLDPEGNRIEIISK